MIRTLAAFLTAVVVLTGVALGQDLTALARLDPARSQITERRDGVDLALTISQPVPYRVHTLANPPRLVLDFRQVDFSALSRDGFGAGARITATRTGMYQPGWSRMVLDLAGPYAVERAGMVTGAEDGSARIEVRLTETDAARFAARAGAPLSRAFPEQKTVLAPSPIPGPEGRLVVALDPGHGGVDPGAVRDDVHEADLMLVFALELRDYLRRTGDYEVILTRDADVFVSLEGRIAIANRMGADVFLSLHADAISEGVARGAQIYTLAEEASSEATAQLAERHDRSDLLAGVDLTGQDDTVAKLLLSLARTETEPRTEALARSLVQGLTDTGIRMHRRAWEKARFSVLKAADIPSALIEVGFISSPGELENLQSAEWRRQAARGIAAGLALWREADAVRAGLVRQ